MRNAGSKAIAVALMVLMAISVFKIGAYYLRYTENILMAGSENRQYEVFCVF